MKGDLRGITRALTLSRATVRMRMARLQARGEILGYTAITRGDVSDAPAVGAVARNAANAAATAPARTDVIVTVRRLVLGARR